jgi:hypothetical protein
MDREHVARQFPLAHAHVATADGPRSACCAYSRKVQPLLQRAGCKPAIHLVSLTTNSPALKSKSEGKHFSVGRRLQPAPAEGPGRVVHAKKGGPQ